MSGLQLLQAAVSAWPPPQPPGAREPLLWLGVSRAEPDEDGQELQAYTQRLGHPGLVGHECTGVPLRPNSEEQGCARPRPCLDPQDVRGPEGSQVRLPVLQDDEA